MDETWLQWSPRLNEILLRLDPSFPIVADGSRADFNHLAGPGADPEVLRAAMNHPDLYAGLEPVPFAVEAILEMEDEGLNVLLCSTPTWANPGCVPGKLADIDLHLGSRWTNRLILAHDKTAVRGAVLVDDKPEITGSVLPEWAQLVHDRSHNRSVPDLPRLTDWRLWRESVYPMLGAVLV